MCLCELRGKTGCCDKDDLPPWAPFSTWTGVDVRARGPHDFNRGNLEGCR